jgi:hypothetical protein
MHGIFDHQARIAFAHERADTLRDVMRAARRAAQTQDGEAGRRTPARLEVTPHSPCLRTQRGAV